MKEWFRARSPSRAAGAIGFVFAVLSALGGAAMSWPDMAEVVENLTLGLAAAWIFWTVCVWLLLRIVSALLSRSPGSSAVSIGFVCAALGIVNLVASDWPNMTEVAGDLAIILPLTWIFYTVCAWLILRIAALFIGKWWEVEETT